ncbi:hypothetical protein [Lysobacter terrae]
MKNAIVEISSIGLLCLAACALTGCELRPHVTSAAARRTGDAELVQVEIPMRDAARIKRRQLYFSIVVINCEGTKKRFAMDPYIDGQRAVEFGFATTGDVAKIAGTMPAHIFDRYVRPCAVLEGGGYFTGRLRSDPVPIASDPDEVREK